MSTIGRGLWVWVCLISAAASAATIRVNFQPADSQVPLGYVVDSGSVFGNRNNGYYYGWNRTNTKVYDRLDEHADQRYNTTAYFDTDAVWEIALDPDEYELFIVCGDAAYTNQINTIDVEGVKLTDPDSVDHFDEYELTVMVSDGRLTIAQATGGLNAKICFIDIVPTGQQNHTPFVMAGDDATLIWPQNRFVPDAVVEDDGKGDPDGFLYIEWSVLSGPAGVTFEPDNHVAAPAVTLPSVGQYVLRLYATDGELERADDLTVLVLPPDCPVGDLTLDCKVQLDDLLLFAEAWLGPNTSVADLVGDDGVNLGDLAHVSANWLEDWTATLQVALEPPDAVQDGALWRIDGGPWLASGYTAVDLREGEHLVEFRPVAAWAEPEPLPVYLYRRTNVLRTGTYTKLPSGPLVINEFMAVNSNLSNLRPEVSWDLCTFVEGEWDYPDWIELRNTTGQPQSLEGWYLTDDPANLTQWRFPAGYTIAPGGHFVVYASGKDATRFAGNYPYVDGSGNLHTNFALSGDGEYLALVQPDGKTVVHEYKNVPKQYGLVSYGLGSDGRVGYLVSPTLGATNSATYDGVVADTKFSVERGFYDQPIDVAITCETPGATIRYTTDGSAPTLSNGQTLNAGQTVRITTTTCLRAAAFKDGCLPTNVDTHTYIFLNDVVKQATHPSTGAQVVPAGYPEIWPGGSYRNPPEPIAGDYQVDPDVADPDGLYGSVYAQTFIDDLKAVPTLSVVLPKDEAFGPTGIYINQNQDGTERRCSAELIDPSGAEPGFQVNCAVRMQGGVSGGGTSLNRWKVPKLSMKLVFRGAYGPSKLRYPLFDDPEATDWFDQIILEARANNVWYHPSSGQNRLAQYTRDQFASDLQNAMGGYGTYGRPVHLYINGLYWGLYWIHERPDESFAAAYLGGEPEDYDVLKHNASLVVNGVQTAVPSFQQLLGVPATDFERLTRHLDVPNFIDYIILHTYLGNWDWAHKNWYASRNRHDPAGRWRFHSWDNEHIMESVGENATGNDGSSTPTGLHHKWMANPEYAMCFADRVYKHLYNEGVLAPDNVRSAYQTLVDKIDRAIVGESARWGDYRRPNDPYTRNKEWWTQRLWLLDTYLPRRRDDMIGQYRALRWYPSFDPPVFLVNGAGQYGGYAATGDVLSMTAAHPVWYTLDGTDPRGAGTSSAITLVPEDAAKAVLIPTGDIGLDWTGGNEPYDDSAWNDAVILAAGTGGVGYENNPGESTSNVPYITYDVKEAMYGHYTSAYVRVPFVLTQDQKDRFTTLTLGVRYDDGFVAYLNGEEIHRVGVSGTPAWNSIGASHENQGMEFFDVSDHADALVVGANILALHGANSSAGSSDFVISAQLTAQEDRPDDVSPTALPYDPAHPLDLQASAHIKARARTAEGTWSALAEATFAVGPVAESLRITELMYHPTDRNAEFVELLNIGAEPINLARVQFDRGIRFVFDPLELAPGERVVVVRDASSFDLRYPDFAGTLAGTYEGRLDNAGERIRLVDALGAVIHDFTYKDGWHPATDGAGFSLTIIDPYNSDLTAWDRKESWRPSAFVGGSPGYDDSGLLPPPGSIVINEVLAHSHLDAPDWIELYNTTDQPIHLGGWFLADSDADDPNRMKYEIADGTIIEPHDYLVFYEDVHFGASATGPGTRHKTFALSEGGERVHLQSGAGGVLTGYIVEETFGASQTDVTFGRYDKPTLSRGYDFVPLESPTPGAANSAPRIGPVILTEIMYRPGSTNEGEEFLELH
ncbi:MAG TPA: hypothetical protein ENN87_02720, partial [Phycisphaerales bacterium]|nr:hypothetical protein [Phycisphaerales bacterium]